MDTNVILGIVITLIIVIPVVILATAGKRKSRKTINKFREFARSKNIELDEYECCENLLVGIDKRTKKFLYKVSTDEAQILDINELRICTYKVNSEILDGDYIDKLEMEFEFIDKNKSNFVLTFYTSANKLTMDEERQVIEKWQRNISTLIR